MVSQSKMSNIDGACGPLRVFVDRKSYGLRFFYYVALSVAGWTLIVTNWSTWADGGETVIWISIIILHVFLAVSLVFRFALIKLAYRGEPVLVIDESGVWDRGSTLRPVRWQEIRSAHILIDKTPYGTPIYVELVLENKRVFSDVVRPACKILCFWRKNVSIDVRGLAKNEDEILAAINCYLSKKSAAPADC